MMYSTIFINTSGDYTEEKLKTEGLKHLEDRKSDLNYFLNVNDESDEIGEFCNYGLSFDFLDAGTFEDQPEGYYRYQFSWGGPSEELRIYHDGTIIFVFLDWFCGIGFDVSHDPVWNQVKEYFEEIGSIDWDSLEPDQIELIDYDTEDYDQEEED